MEKDALGQGIGLAGNLDLEAGAHRVLLFVVFMYICMHWAGCRSGVVRDAVQRKCEEERFRMRGNDATGYIQQATKVK